ncbi:MAG: MazG family protein [Clostridia bacterium]|nr:MazG family protein [Clostridia bacterium]
MNIDEKIAEINKKESFDTSDLELITVILRDRCPWDREQTHESSRQCFIEEVYEACDAIDKKDPENLCEELGDVLLQVLFHSVMSQEDGQFDYSDVVNGICRKLIVRHPHVFGDVAAETTAEVLSNWDKIKADTKGQKAPADTVRDVPLALPALMRAQKIAKRAAKAGLYELPGIKVGTDVEARKREIAAKLFELCAEAQSLDVSAEEILAVENERFLQNIH